MTTDSHATTTRPRKFGQRDYILPDTVQSNIYPQHYDGAPGLWAYARALLIETCDALAWTPLSLFVGVEFDNDTDDTTAVVLTIVARDEHQDRTKDVVTVVWRQDYSTGSPGARRLAAHHQRRRAPPGFHPRPPVTADPRDHHPRRRQHLSPTDKRGLGIHSHRRT